MGFGEGINVVVDVVGSSAGSRVGTCEGAVVVRTHVGTGTGRGEGSRETVGNGCVDVVDVDVGVSDRGGGGSVGAELGAETGRGVGTETGRGDGALDGRAVGAETGGGRKVVVVVFGAGVGTGDGARRPAGGE